MNSESHGLVVYIKTSLENLLGKTCPTGAWSDAVDTTEEILQVGGNMGACANAVASPKACKKISIADFLTRLRTLNTAPTHPRLIYIPDQSWPILYSWSTDQATALADFISNGGGVFQESYVSGLLQYGWLNKLYPGLTYTIRVSNNLVGPYPTTDGIALGLDKYQIAAQWHGSFSVQDPVRRGADLWAFGKESDTALTVSFDQLERYKPWAFPEYKNALGVLASYQESRIMIGAASVSLPCKLCVVIAPVVVSPIVSGATTLVPSACGSSPSPTTSITITTQRIDGTFVANTPVTYKIGNDTPVTAQTDSTGTLVVLDVPTSCTGVLDVKVTSTAPDFKNSVATKSVSATPSATPGSVPGVPTNLSGVRTGNQVNLTWSAPASSNSTITDYVVEFLSDPGSTWVIFDDGKSELASASVTGLTAGKMYFFRVSAINSFGRGYPTANEGAQSWG
ncbi:MAG: fibronectin type III domain-containing protein [Ilumatobacteraceae bacterium]|nr:fibronectin type III domain-containing protein [Ilumatobacteraceae bacterium]